VIRKTNIPATARQDADSGQRPYVAPDEDYLTAQTATPEAAVRAVAEPWPESEFVDPTRAPGNYEGAEYRYPGGPPGEIWWPDAGGFDTPWMADPAGGRPGLSAVFRCTCQDCFCPGETTCVVVTCTQPIVGVKAGATDKNVSLGAGGKVKPGDKDVKTTINRSGAHSARICMAVPADNVVRVNLDVSMRAKNGLTGVSRVWVDECAEREFVDCSGGEIGYTTDTMEAGASQTLSVANNTAAFSHYSFVIASGGGSLGEYNPATGEIEYTAPATNAECANNPTISLSCNGTVVDTLNLGIIQNGYPGTLAYRKLTGYYRECYSENPVGILGWSAENPCFCYHTYALYWCGGTAYSAGDCGAGFYPNWTSQAVCDDCDVYGTTVGAVYDHRSAAMKTGGCCPPAALFGT